MKWRFPEIPMIPSEIIKKVRKIQFKTTRLLNAPLAGQYASVFKGMGIEFDEVREYVPGDEIRTIDWNVTARAGTPYVKRYVEERELTLMLVVDLRDRKSTRLNSSHVRISYAVFCLKKKKK